MNFLKVCFIFCFVVALLVIHGPTIALSEAVQREITSGDNEPIIIRSNSFEVDHKKYMITFLGDVDVRNGDLTIACQKMFLYYQNLPDLEAPEKTRSSIEKIIAEGDVKISRPAGGLATAEKAVYYSNDEKVVLTGKPTIKQGDDFVEGARITLFLAENRSIVEGSSDAKAKAVLFPKSDKR
jgi:lipopolysaccharide export system protein LptA